SRGARHPVGMGVAQPAPQSTSGKLLDGQEGLFPERAAGGSDSGLGRVVLGVEPAEFALLVLVGELLENFSHANVRVGFGTIVSKLLVSPAFHRLHHMRADASRPGLHQCNFSQTFPIWDILFKTALYGEAPRATGV